MRLRKALLSLTLAVALLLGAIPAATGAEMAAEGGGRVAYIGQNGQLFIMEESGELPAEPLYAGATQSIVALTERDIYFLREDEAFVPEADDEYAAMPAWVLVRMPLIGGAQTVCAEAIRGEAVYIPDDGVIYYLTHGGSATLSRYSVAIQSPLEDVDLDSERGSLKKGLDGLLYLYDRADLSQLFVAATGGFVDVPAYMQGELDTFAPFEVLRGASTLKLRAKGANVWRIVDSAASACAEMGGNLYYAQRDANDDLHIRVYLPSTNAILDVATLVGDYQDALTAAGGKLYVVSNESARIVSIDPANGRIAAFASLANYEATEPLLKTAGSLLLLYENADPDAPVFAHAFTLGTSAEPTPTPRPTVAPYETLRRGDLGDAVMRLQQRLKDLGYLFGSVDGNFGGGTYQAVCRFQEAIGYEQTGVATPELQKRIFAANAPVYDRYIELAGGDVGTRVRDLQERLSRLGYPIGTIDGEYGSQTERAVCLFQGDNGYMETGRASVRLQELLFSSRASRYVRFKTLKEGDTGERVKILQRRLLKLGYFDGSIGGNFSSRTLKAVKRFQTQIGLEPSGKASVKVQERLFAKDAPPYDPWPDPTPRPEPTPKPPTPASVPQPPINESSSKKDVQWVTVRLQSMGYLSNAPGKYTEAVREAVKQFQMDQFPNWKKKKYTGYVDAKTLAALRLVPVG